MRKQSSRFKFVRPWESDLKYDPSRRFTIPPLKTPPQINDFDSPQYDFEIYQPYDGPNYVNPNPYERYEPQNFLNDPYERPQIPPPQFQPQNGPIYPIPQFDSFEFMPYEDSLAGQWDRCTKEMEEENDRLEWEEQFRQAEIRNKQRRRLERIRKKHPAVPPIEDNDWGVQPSHRIDRLMN